MRSTVPDDPAAEGRAVQKHPRAVRWMHWVNFPLLTVMTWSGLLIYWAYDPYRIGCGETTLVRFFPDGFYEALGLTRQLGQGLAFHFFFGSSPSTACCTCSTRRSAASGGTSSRTATR